MGMLLTRRVMHAWLLAGAAFIAACGGGGGGDGGGAGSPPPPPPPPAAATAPVITVAPASVSVTAGQAANFTVTADGSAPLSYQWLRDGAAIGGATGDGYSIGAAAIGDNAARFSVVVSNAAGSVTSGDAVLTVTTTMPPPSSTPPPLYVPVWSSTDTTVSTGSYTLSVVDPVAPGTLVAVDQVATTNNNLAILRVRGGTLDPATGEVLDPGVRNLVYVKDGSLYRVNLDKGGATPAPVRLSTETQVTTPVAVAAASATGDDALISYFLPRNGGIRYVGLSTRSDSSPRAAPVFPGDLLTANLTGWATDPTSGAITTLYWESARSDGGRRLFRTDPSFGNPVSVANFASDIDTLWAGIGVIDGGRMRHGLFFIADGALRRLDFASGAVRVVHGGVTSKVGGGIFDDTHVYLLVETAGGRQLLRAADDDSSAAQVISSGAEITGYAHITGQVRDYLLFVTGNLGETAVSVRKTDGLLTPLANPSPPAGLTHSWTNSGTSFSAGTGGNRVYYHFPGRVGSVHADGTDRRELDGYFGVTVMAQPAIRPHRLHTIDLNMPAARVLLQRGSSLTWLELATGDLGVTIGTTPGVATFGNEPAPYHDYLLGRVGAIGYAGRAEVSPGTSVGRLDALYLTDQAGSLLRLTNHIP